MAKSSLEKDTPSFPLLCSILTQSASAVLDNFWALPRAVSTREFYQMRGLISSLKGFCWLNHEETLSLDLKELFFLRKTPQLEKIHVADPLAAGPLGSTVNITLFQSSVDSLTLSWQ